MNLTTKPKVQTKFFNAAVNRMRYPVFVLSLVVAFSASKALAVAIQATGAMSVDGNEWSVPIDYNSELGLYGFGTWNSSIDNFTGYEWTGEDGTHVTISGVLDPDPTISYTIGVTDFGAPSIFGFFFSTPIIVGASPTQVDASVSGGLTDFSGNGVTMTPTAAFLQISDVGAPTTNMGVDIGGIVSGGPAAPTTYPFSFSAGPQPGPAGPWTTLSVTVGFSLTGGQDSVGMTGIAQIVPVPEPSSVFMLASGVLGLLYFARRRRK